MRTSTRALGVGLVGLALLGTVTRGTPARAQDVRSEETVRSVRKMLERLPYYGVFDSLFSALNAAPSHSPGMPTKGI